MPHSIEDDAIVMHAPAKLNLCLHVGPVGPDGFHPLDSVVALIDLCDELVLRRRSDGRVKLACDAELGPTEDNLVVRAARALRRHAGIAVGAEIALRKRIPAAAGLGGGSSDAAAALRGLCRLWNVQPAAADLHALACELGSDVPLFLHGGPVRMRGRGEQVTPATVHPFRALLVTPPFGCPTGEVYRAFDSLATASAEECGAAVPHWETFAHPPQTWGQAVVNDLTPAARRVTPEVGQWLDRLSRESPYVFHLTGSGSAMFAVLPGGALPESALSAVPDWARPFCMTVASIAEPL